MQQSLTPASASLSPNALSDILWSTNPKLNSFIFRSRSVLHKLLACEWSAQVGLLCHKYAFTICDETSVIGLLVGHTAEEYGQNFDAALALQTEELQPTDARHLQKALFCMDRLFPAPRDQSYYVLELATAPETQGMGLATRLLDAAQNRARDAGCTPICLDVAADNAAVGFYRNKGFEVEIETRIPFLQQNHDIGSHLHMVRRLEAGS